MNIAKEIAKAEKKRDIKLAFKRFINIIKTYLCTHNEVGEEIILMDLGNSTESILEEIYGEEEAKKSHQMKVRRVFCLNCGRILYQEVISDVVETDQTANK